MGNWIEDNITKPVSKAVKKAGNWISDNGGTVGKLVGIANPELGLAISVGSQLFGGGSDDKIQQYTNAGYDAQTAYQQAALQNYREMMDRQLSVATADKQMAYDIARGQFASNQQNILPYQQASLSALQALPMLQQLLGVPAYNLSKTISQYTPPEVDYTTLYKDIAENMFGTDAETAEDTAPAADSGIRVNIKATDEDVANSAAARAAGTTPATGTTTTATLTPYTGPAYNLEDSPIFQWQKKIANEGLIAQLAASGLAAGTYAQRELSRQNQELSANERNRVIGNLSSLVNMGMGGSGLGQATFVTPQSTNIASIYGQAGRDINSIYDNLGSIAGNYNLQSALNASNAAKADTTISDLIQLASNSDWFKGGSSKSDNYSIVDPGIYDLTYDLKYDW